MLDLGVETFLTVVREKNISAAANKLHVAQTTVSKRLKSLEDTLEMTLLERSKGVQKVRLTPAGEAFHKIAEQWSHLFQEAMILKSQGPKLSLSIGATYGINNYLLPKVYDSISQHLPPVQLTIRSIHSWDIYAQIENRQVDLGFASQKYIYPNVTVTKFFSSPMVVLRPSAGSKQETATLHPLDLDPSHEVSIIWRPEFKAWHQKWWNPHCPSRITIDYVSLAFSLLINPVQWLILPLHIAKAALNRGNYNIYQLSDPPPDYVCYKLTHKNPTILSKEAINIFDHYLQQHL